MKAVIEKCQHPQEGSQLFSQGDNHFPNTFYGSAYGPGQDGRGERWISM